MGDFLSNGATFFIKNQILLHCNIGADLLSNSLIKIIFHHCELDCLHGGHDYAYKIKKDVFLYS